MVIIHSDKSGFTNFDNVYAVSVQGRYIHAETKDGHKSPVAVYDSPERAEEVFCELMEKLFPRDDSIDSDKIIPFIASDPDMYDDFMESVHVLSILPQWYYMPEE